MDFRSPEAVIAALHKRVTTAFSDIPIHPISW
jgi:hypothetical protein